MNDLIYHYTSIEGLLGVVQKERINLWATRYNFLNDPLEYVFAKQNVEPLLSKLSIKENKRFDPEMHMYPYIVSFCEVDDNLNMWRLYGNNGYGFVLGFERSTLEEMALQEANTLQIVSYTNTANIENIIIATRDTYYKTKESDNIIDYYDICSLIKREDYEHEHEIRYLISNYDSFDFKQGKLTRDSEDYSKIKHRCSNRGIIPYIELELPKNTLKSITLGYKLDFDTQKDSVEKYLQSNGYENIEYHKSIFDC